MKLKDLFSKSENSSNKQVKWNLKKRKLKESGLTEDDLLNIKIDFKLKEIL
jgi:hypothetical protein